MEVDLSPDTEKKLNERAALSGQMWHEVVVTLLQEHVEETARIEAMLDGRYDELKSGEVQVIAGEEVVA